MAQLNLKKQLYLAKKYPKTAINTLIDPVFYHKKATPFPRLINCFITERCNFNCPMCHVKNSRLEHLQELSLNDLKKFFKQISPYSPSVSLAGGEPLMHPDIIKIIKYLNHQKIVKGMVTNGLLLEEMASDLISSGLDFLAISLDGPDEKTQYKRGLVKNSFPKIINGIKKIIELRGKNPFPNIRIATVISKANIKNFDKIYQIAKELGVDEWSISHHFYYYDKIKQQQKKFGDKNNFGTDVWGEYNGQNKEFFNQEERKIIKEKLAHIQELSKTSKVKITMPTSFDIKNFYTGTIPKKTSTCTAPFNQIFLRGNGDIEICHGYILGNIKDDKIINIWTGQKTTRFQQYIKKHKTIPACFRCCSLNPKF